jgi:hypothetical protein
MIFLLRVLQKSIEDDGIFRQVPDLCIQLEYEEKYLCKKNEKS